MSPLEELAQLASERTRRLFVAENPIDLSMKDGENCIYILELPTSAPGSAGGRVGRYWGTKATQSILFQTGRRKMVENLRD